MQSVMTGPEKRRRRPTVSCTLCRRRKIRCNRERPCSNCLRSRSGACVYENPNIPPFPQRHIGQVLTIELQESMPIGSAFSTSASTVPSHPPSSVAASCTELSTPTSEQFTQDAEAMRLKFRIRQLENQLSHATIRPIQYPAPHSDIETTSSRLSGTLHVYRKRGASGQLEPIPHSVSVKTRLFGQSHWGVSSVYLVSVHTPPCHCLQISPWMRKGTDPQSRSRHFQYA